MKRNLRTFVIALPAVIASLLFSFAVMAQDKIVIDKGEAESWLTRNWMWVAGAVLLIIILAAGSSSSRRRSRTTTTVTRDDVGNTRRVTTTEVDD